MSDRATYLIKMSKFQDIAHAIIEVMVPAGEKLEGESVRSIAYSMIQDAMRKQSQDCVLLVDRISDIVNR